MRRIAIVLGVIAVALAGLSATTLPRACAQDDMSREQAMQAGLVVQWTTQLDGVGTSDLVNFNLVVDENQAKTFFEIVGGNLREVIAETDISPNGKRFKDVAEVEGYANIRAEIMQARLAGNGSTEKVQVNKYALPKSTIYCVSGSGVVQSIDAESGRVNWSTEVGTYRFPTAGVGGGKKFVAAVNGSTVYCLNTMDGKILWQRRCETAVMGPPAVTESAVFVPLVDGRLQVFDIQSSGLKNQTLVSNGAAFNAPTVSGNVVSWATDKGVLSVAPANDMNKISFRLKGESAILAPAAAKGGLIFAATSNGFVYAIDQKKRSVAWSVSLGERVSQSPYPLGDHIFLVTDEKHLYKFDARTGDLNKEWSGSVSDVKAIVGAGKERLYVMGANGSILALDQLTGNRTGSMSNRFLLEPLANGITDRIYLCSGSGIVQCLREVGAVTPFFHSDEFAAVAAPADQSETDPSSDQPNMPSDETDPFAEPGQKRETKPADTEDPFGESAPTKKPADVDPFGGGGSSTPPGNKGGQNDDPFGGG